jgi:hypothetical protein
VGRPTLASGFRKEGAFLDLKQAGDFDRLQRNPDLKLGSRQASVPLVIERAQRLLSLFPTWRVIIDRHRDAGKLRALSDFVDENHFQYCLLINNAERPAWLTTKILQIPSGFAI